MRAPSHPQSTWAVVPVKPFALAKRRLAPLLSADERAQFAQLMLQDVLAALAHCGPLAGIAVVTRDPAARDLARAFGAEALDDPGRDLNAAVRTGSAFLGREAGAGMVVVPADIPLLAAATVARLMDHISAPRAVALVAATRDGGTNLLACRPVDAIAAYFGPDSFRRHWQAAHDAGLAPTVMAAEDAGLDIDQPEDIAAFLSQPSNTRSRAFLAALEIEQRREPGALQDTRRHKVKSLNEARR